MTSNNFFGLRDYLTISRRRRGDYSPIITEPKAFLFPSFRNVLVQISLFFLLFLQVHERIEKMKNKMKELKQERDRAHKELGEYKAMTTVALEVLSFSEVLINLTGEASLKTDYLERIMALATKRNVDIKRSRGMKTAVDSFQDSWVNIFDLMNSNRIAILNDRRLVSIQEARYANTYLFDILIVCLAVLMVLLFTFVFPK